MLLFDRTYVLLISTATNSVEITELRVAFNITKTLKADKNKMIIEIYNLSKETRSILEEKDVQIIFQAGYDGLAETIFVGDVSTAIHSRTAADVITKVEVVDGGKAAKNAIISESFAPGTQVQQVVDKLVKSFALPIKEVPTDLNEQFANGISLVGLAKDSLGQIANSFNLDWSIQNNEIQVLRPTDTSIDEEVLLTPDTGLLGIPEKVNSNVTKLPNDPNNKYTGLKAVALLQPKFLPGRKVTVQSSLINGSYKIESVVHRGDTHGSEWISQLEGTEV